MVGLIWFPRQTFIAEENVKLMIFKRRRAVLDLYLGNYCACVVPYLRVYRWNRVMSAVIG